jgi:glycosyltransferase involved in cell wall biosynthesis
VSVVVVDVVLPCLDEARALPWILQRMPEGYRPIVCDIARALGATVVEVPRRGFGAACHAGLEAATAPVVAFCDCDGSLDPRQLPRVVDPVLDGTTELALGRRRPATLRSWPVHARIANRVLAHQLRRRTGLRLRDLGPMRAGRREQLLDLQLRDRRSGYPLEMVVRAADRGWRVTETDVDYLPRTGRSKVTGTLRGTVQAVQDMSAVLGG